MRIRSEITIGMIAVACLALAGRVGAGDIHSNGRGGGLWSDPGTWKGNALPGTGDVAVVSMGDAVIFDGTNTERLTCRQLLIDPRGILSFKADEAQYVLSVGGPVETYGTIRMEGRKSPQGSMELRLMAEKEEERTIRLLRDSSFFAYGAEDLPEGRRNVIISTGEPSTNRPNRLGTLVGGPDAMIELMRARVADISVRPTSMDNTGFKPKERVNISGNSFVGMANLYIMSCDTPSVKNNRFETSAPAAPPTYAIYVGYCQLAEVKNNTVAGSYADGLCFTADTDSSCVGNSIARAGCGIYWYGQNAMIKENTISDCPTALALTSMSGVLEATTIRGSNSQISVSSATVQLTDLRFDGLPPTNLAMTIETATVNLLNCNIAPVQIKVGTAPPAGTGPWVQNMQYVVAQVKGARPPDAQVEIRTAAASGGPPGGAADLNVRNSPAKLSSTGLTPLPRTLKPLIVMSWKIGRDGRKADAPFYDLIVSKPGAKEGTPSTVLKTQVVEPKDTWFRPDPNQPVPTVEVTL